MRNGYTAGANNTYYENQYIAHGTTSKTGGTYSYHTFQLPSDYVDGEDITIYFSWTIADAGNVLDYLITTYYSRDGLVITAEDTFNATWTANTTSHDMNQETLTFTGTNLLAFDMVHIMVKMEDDNNVRISREYGISLGVPVSGSD